MTMEAKPVVKNKFWVVEEGGRQVATIQASPDGLVLVKGHQREKFVNFKLLKDKYNWQRVVMLMKLWCTQPSKTW